MIDPRKITPLLSNMTVERELGRGPNGVVYLVTRRMDGKKLALKHIPVPSSDAQTKALIFAGAVSSEADAHRYYSSLVKDMKAELLQLNNIKNASGLLKVRGYQVDQKIIGVGYDVYILADYCQPLPAYLNDTPISKLQALNLAIDLCSSLEQLRSGGLIHKDVKPSNVYLGDNHHFVLGDLGLVKKSELEYTSMPDQLLSPYTAPEVLPEDAHLSETMDIYSVGMILYEIYNGGLLPLDDDGTFNRKDEELPAPAYADLALAEIILRACAYDPEGRYQDPAEMKQALILYMQRGSISNEPLVPVPDTPQVEAEVDVAAIAATVEAGQVAEGVTFLSETPEGQEEPAEKTMGEILQESQPEFQTEPEKRNSLNELGEDDLLLPPEEEISVEAFLASIRGTPGLEVVSMDAKGNTTTVPGYETEDDLPEGTEFVDSADNHADAESTSNDVIQEDAADEETNVSESGEEDTVHEDDEKPEMPVKRGIRKSRPAPRNDDINVYDDGYEEEEEDEDDEEGLSAWKKVLISVIVLLVLAGGAFSLYTFKTDTVRSMTSEVLSSSSVLIQAETKNTSAMEVICSNAAGEVARLPYTEGGTTFTDLSPSTTYSFELSSTAGKFLLGSHTLEAMTEEMTNLTSFGATDISAVSAKLSLGGTGQQPEKWLVSATSETGDTVTAESDTYEILVEGLTPDTTYTATVSRSDGDILGGTTTCTFTTMGYTELGSFEQIAVTNDSMTVQWAYTGTVPESWTVTCQGTDGSSTTQEVTGSECTLDGLTAGVTYTVSLSCPSLRTTDLSSISVGIPSVKVTSITSSQNEDGNIEVSWEFEGDTTPSEWSVSYAYESSSEVTPSLVTTDTNSVVLENLVPDANYTIKVQTADEFTVGGNVETTCVTAPADDFTQWECSDAEMTFYAVEDNPDGYENPTTTFTPDQHLAYEVEVSYEATEEDKTVKTLYVVRDSEGTPVLVYANDVGRTWSGSWLTAKHTGDIPDMPQEPGSYTFEIYFDGDLLVSSDFTVSE